MTSAIQNILTGVQEMAKAREHIEKAQQQEAPAKEAGTSTDEMTPAEMTEAINKLSAIVMDLTQKLYAGKGE